MKHRPEIKIGDKFGRLTIIGEKERIKRPGDSNTRTWVMVRCECGKEFKIALGAIVYGKTKSCGCLQKESYATGMGRKTHGLTRTREYYIWVTMKARCFNPKATMYYAYGAVGITVCKRWADSFLHFLQDMGKSPTMGHSLDRYPNQRGNYEPGNVRWATRSEQSRNRYTNVILEMDGVSAPLVEWSELFSIKRETIRQRINKGMTLKEALFTPVRQRN